MRFPSPRTREVTAQRLVRGRVRGLPLHSREDARVRTNPSPQPSPEYGARGRMSTGSCRHMPITQTSMPALAPTQTRQENPALRALLLYLASERGLADNSLHAYR